MQLRCCVHIKRTVERLTSVRFIDPAGPYFTSLFKRTDFCLSKNDATFVQVLHTSSGIYGTSAMMGHADFIVNNGKLQKACVDDIFFLKDFCMSCQK